MNDRYVGKVRVENDSAVGYRCKLLVGDTLIPFYSLDIHIAAGELVTVTAKVPAERIDIVALARHTQLEIVKPGDDGAAES